MHNVRMVERLPIMEVSWKEQACMVRMVGLSATNRFIVIA
jgi:hypothetical protein